MSALINALRAQAVRAPHDTAVTDLVDTLSFAELLAEADRMALALSDRACRRIGLYADNGIGWVVADLAAQISGASLVPLPVYFHPAQIEHLLDAGGVDSIIADDQAASLALEDKGMYEVAALGAGLRLHQRPASATWSRTSPPMKITFTSGSTGQPKGVCLDYDMLSDVALRLKSTFEDLGIERHLCVLPLATLLENVAGVHVPLMLGSTVVVPSLSKIGLYGSSRIDAEAFRHTIETSRAESLVLQPQLLRVLTAACAERPLPHLQFVAVGGAKVAEADLDAAHAVGIPAYQGYGLSECGSVVALNRPGAHRAGSVGRPLSGVKIGVSDDGEILVHEQGMLGYLGEASESPDLIRTGDLGHIDKDGFLYITGRRKNVFITSFGRNVSPEWPEAELAHQPAIAQVCVFGEAMPCNTAVIVPSRPDISQDEVAEAVHVANRNLPDYARVADWVIADEPFAVANGLLTETGKPKRSAIALRFVNHLHEPSGSRPSVSCIN